MKIVYTITLSKFRKWRVVRRTFSYDPHTDKVKMIEQTLEHFEHFKEAQIYLDKLKESADFLLSQ